MQASESSPADTATTGHPAVWIQFLITLAVTAAVAFAYHFGPPRTRGHDIMSHGIFWGVSIILIVALPFTFVAGYIFTGLTATAIGTVFPIYESIRAVCTPEEDDDKSWLQYWMIGGILFISTEWVDDLMKESNTVYWYASEFFLFVWLFYPQTDGAALIYEHVTEPFIAPRVRPLAAKMTNMLTALYQTMVNAVHLWIIWIVFMFLPAGLKRFIAVVVGTVYPLVSSITAAATEEVDDDTYWLTYWSVYGCLFLAMELLETWLGWIPGFYTLVILAEIYLMLPMMMGAEKVFRKILVPLAGLQELLLLRDAIQVKKRMLKDLDPERAKTVRKAIAKYYDDDDDYDNRSVLELPVNIKNEFLSSWKSIKMPAISNPFGSTPSAGEEPSETTPMV